MAVETEKGIPRKLTKEEADYKAGGSTDPRSRCGSCVMFEPPFGCSLVQGLISADAICSFWEPDDEPTL